MQRTATCIVGAGFSGLAAARALAARGLPYVILERAPGPGGLWREKPASESPSKTPAYRSLHLNTARDITAFRDFPMPSDYPIFPSQQQVSVYLEQFADHIGLSQHAEFGTEVVSITPVGEGGWEVTSRDLSTGEQRNRTFAHVIVATGHNTVARRPEPVPGEKEFAGANIHSIDFTDAAPFAGRKVLVIGIGNSACDISAELSRVSARTIISMRRGAHVVPKQLLGTPIDAIVQSRWWRIAPFRLRRRWVELVLHVVRGPMTRYGIPKPPHRIFSAPMTVSDELLNRISHGHIVPKPALTRIDNSTERSTAHFADGSSEEIDAIVRCTGYEVSFPFLKPRHLLQVNGQVALYQRIVARTHPGLYFLGLIRPFGATTFIFEQQAEWIAELVEGTCAVPDWQQMNAEIDEHLGAVLGRLGASQTASIQVDVPVYLRALKRERKEGRRRAAMARAVPAEAEQVLAHLGY